MPVQFRDISFKAGVAIGLVALAELSIESGDMEEARRLLYEADSLSEAKSGNGIKQLVEQVRRQIK